MPDVARSDSQRSDTSLKPRVSFNRDVHVKRIVPRENVHIVGTVNGDGHHHPTNNNNVGAPVRKERIKKTKKQLEQEAAEVLSQRDQIDREKYYTLPSRKKPPGITNPSNTSLDRKSTRRRNSSDLVNGVPPPKKPPRTFTTLLNNQQQHQSKPSIFDLFKRTNNNNNKTTSNKAIATKKSNLRRSVSDASNLKSNNNNRSNEKVIILARSNNKLNRSDDGSEENLINNSHHQYRHKKLSPIVEVTPRDDYFSDPNNDDTTNNNNNNKENDGNHGNLVVNASVTDKLKEYIDEVDEELYKETGIRVDPVENKKKKDVVEIVLIDVDKAEKISSNSSNRKSKLKNATLGKIKSLANKKLKTSNSSKTVTNLAAEINSQRPTTTIREKKKDEQSSPMMIHSSQKPAEKLPLTRGRTVDKIIKRLSNDSTSPPPPKTGLLIAPNMSSVQHNNNQPFSYTRGLSPDKCMMMMSNEHLPPSSPPVIYAQVVCGGGGTNGTTGGLKQTIHTTVKPTHMNGHRLKQTNSDSDEGLGGEEQHSGGGKRHQMTYFGDDNTRRETTTTTYDYEKSVYLNGSNNDVVDGGDLDLEEQESPILPKFTKLAATNKGFFDYDRKYEEQDGFQIDSTFRRGRGDGMDAKRRESLTEQFDNDFLIEQTPKTGIINGRSDLSARRDLLESRINRRLINDQKIINYQQPNASSTPMKFHSINRSHNNLLNSYDNINNNEPKSFDSQLSDYRSSPETSHNNNNYYNKYKQKSQKTIVKNRDLYKSTPDIHNNRKYDDEDYDPTNNYTSTYYDSLRREKKSGDNKIKSFFKHKYEHQQRRGEKDKFGDSGIENDIIRRDSLSGDHHIRNNNNHNRPQQQQPRRGISRSPRREHLNNNDSEDEGFASSLLIASERQHTEDNINSKRNNNGYDSDRAYSPRNDDDPYHHLENMEYNIKGGRYEYAPRERSIDDGSHFDPRIDSKEFERIGNNNKGSSTLKRIEKKPPPKPEKKRGLDKVKQLFSRDTKKKKDKQGMVPEENLRARYTEYKGSSENLVDAKDPNELNRQNYDYSNRKRLPTPSPSPTREIQRNRNQKSEVSHSWFKSLDRLSHRKTKKDPKDLPSPINETTSLKPTNPTKSLRFFGDTDIESSNDSSVRQKPSSKLRAPLVTTITTRPSSSDRRKSQSTRDLHNISEEFSSPELKNRKTNYKSMLNIFESGSNNRNNNAKSATVMKPPMSPHQNGKQQRNEMSRSGRGGSEERGRASRRKNDGMVSSVESSTEGDSSQQSQRSIVYLHAATVGDIPGPEHLRSTRRGAEDLPSSSSVGESSTTPRIQQQPQVQVKTLSRSFSVLAPWRPRHYRDEIDIDYNNSHNPSKSTSKNGKYEQKGASVTSSRKENVSTLKKKAHETRRSNQNMSSTLSRKSRSKENVAAASSSTLLRRSNNDLMMMKDPNSTNNNSTLYKKKERLPRENLRYNKDDSSGSRKMMSSKCLSVEHLGTTSRPSRKNKNHQHHHNQHHSSSRDLSRSMSMPKDPEKSAGWFSRINNNNNNKKNGKKSGSTQRL